MKLDESQVMSFPRKLVEHVILGLYSPVNSHLVKLIAFDFPEETRAHFRRELKSWLRKIQSMRFKPQNRTGSWRFYFDLLFDYPFGGVEVHNMRLIMGDIAEEYDHARPIKTPEEMVEWLRAFHTQLAERLHKGEDVLDLIPE
ncbi:MAG: hypothetical protein ACM3JG_17515 [Thiohalocapsa sp.]